MTVTPLFTDMAGNIPFLSRKEALQFSALKLVRDVRSQSHPPPYYPSIFSSSFQSPGVYSSPRTSLRAVLLFRDPHECPGDGQPVDPFLAFQRLGHWNGSVQFSHLVISDSLRPHGLQHARLPCPSPLPGACSNSCPSSRWCHLTTSFSIVPFSFNLSQHQGLFQWVS